MANSREEVLDFTSAELLVPKSDLRTETSLMHDLGVAGDDGFEFVEKFFEKFSVMIDDDFDPTLYFGEEASGDIFSMIFELFSNRFQHSAPRLTVGDLIASVDAGKLMVPK